MTYTDSKKLEERPKNVKEYKLGVALPTNETPKTKKVYQKKQILPPPLSNKTLIFAPDFFKICIMKDFKCSKL